jgi:hypothetical protein
LQRLETLIQPKTVIRGDGMRRVRTAAATITVVALIGSILAAGAAAQTGTQKAADVGITATQIRLGVIADVDTPVSPGLFQSAVNAMNAWAKLVNQHGGIAGRKVVIDFIDSKLSPDNTRNAIIQACSQDFALVGTEALFMNNVDDLVGCKDAQGQPVGLPDLAGLALDPAELCSPVTYTVSGDASYCPTLSQHPQTYAAQQGDFLYYLKNNKNLHGIFLVPTDLQSTKNSQSIPFEAGLNLGIKKDGTGFYDVTAQLPQSALTPFIQAVKANNSNFVYNGESPGIMVELRREAVLQGVNSVKVWACNQGCYDAGFLQQGGADVEGTYSVLTTLPFYSEYNANASLKSLVGQLGGVDKLNENGLEAWLAALVFQGAAQQALANGGTLTRQSLLAAVKTEHAFTGQGIVGPTDVGGHRAPTCIVMAQVKNGKWVRAYPSTVGTFDCSKKNVVQIKLDLTS